MKRFTELPKKSGHHLGGRTMILPKYMEIYFHEVGKVKPINASYYESEGDMFVFYTEYYGNNNIDLTKVFETKANLVREVWSIGDQDYQSNRKTKRHDDLNFFRGWMIVPLSFLAALFLALIMFIFLSTISHS